MLFVQMFTNKMQLNLKKKDMIEIGRYMIFSILYRNKFVIKDWSQCLSDVCYPILRVTRTMFEHNDLILR